MTLSPLPSGRNYTVAVEAFNIVGSSGKAWSPGVHTTLSSPLQPTRPFLAPPLSGLPLSTTLHVTWLPPFDNGAPVTGYELL
eukprot:1617016-Prymnesium_polylepis.1